MNEEAKVSWLVGNLQYFTALTGWEANPAGGSVYSEAACADSMQMQDLTTSKFLDWKV